MLQEVFAAAFNAMLADEREINVRPWLYRIARNRSLNHLRRAQAVGMDSMDVHLSEGGLTTADKVHKREEFRLLIADVQDLPETQRTALLLREIDALSYDQIAEAMETTVPSVKSLLVRARVSLAEAAEARLLSCDEVRLELGEVAEGLTRTTAPVRRHLRTCERCTAFRKQLRSQQPGARRAVPGRAAAAAQEARCSRTSARRAAAGGGDRRRRPAARSAGAGAALQVGFGTVASKAAAGLAAAAIVTAGAVEVQHAAKPRAETQDRRRAGRAGRRGRAPAPTAVADDRAGRRRLRARSRRRRAEARRQEGRAPRPRPKPRPTADADADRDPGRHRDADRRPRRPPPRATAATRPRCRPTRSAPPSPAAAPTRRTPPPPTPSGPVLAAVPTPAAAAQPEPTPSATPEQTATPEAPPAPTARRRSSRRRRDARPRRRRSPTPTADRPRRRRRVDDAHAARRHAQ